MSVDCFTEKEIKARKAHRCEYCGKQIEPGHWAHVEKGVFEGKWFARYSCYDGCSKYLHGFWETMDNQELCIPLDEAFRFYLAENIHEFQYWPFEGDWEERK